jgi:CheY-like chemotaxis protein
MSRAARPPRRLKRAIYGCLTMERSHYHSSPPETILFVEDEMLVRVDMAEYLRECGYKVHEANGADEARDVLNSKMAIDLVIADIRMAGEMDRIALPAWAKSNRAFVSKEPLHDRDDSIAFLTKPYTGRTLFDTVRVALAKRPQT